VLKKLTSLRLTRILLLGISAGVILGFTLWAGFVDANRYLADGYPRLALDSLRRSLNVYTLGAVLLFALVGLTHHLLSRWWKRPYAANAALWLLIATGAATVSLRLSPWTPRAHSLRGGLLFGSVALAGIWLAWLAARHERGVRRGVGSPGASSAAPDRPAPLSSCWPGSTPRPPPSSTARPGPGSTSC
jgi:hypothetical protein